MKREQQNGYLSPQVEIAQIAVECGFAATGGSGSLPEFTVDPDEI